MSKHTKKELEHKMLVLSENLKLHRALGYDVTEDVRKLALCRTQLKELMLGNYYSDIVSDASKLK